MEKKKAKTTRKSGRHLRVPVLPDEEEAIKEKARQAGLSVAAYLRNVGMGYRIQGVIDAELVRELAKINGDQGRLGGLLKLWLTNSEKLGNQDPDQLRRLIHGVLDRIITMQSALLRLATESRPKI
ncbi:conjugal transfer transcriptional regulator TraJ [Paraburkholderia mimosarum]|uniref:conjugal transfer transcriptional regulator TraJ n=1 Tax=Paraburkholderia mimosarum TaxID=312026 RepID=UPI000428E024|nr:conjugal transfer transcriptional regulator TraJ [Paraburkholderia mimosarum]